MAKKDSSEIVLLRKEIQLELEQIRAEMLTETNFERRMDLRDEAMLLQVRDMFLEFRSDFYTRIDPVLKEVNDNFEERTIQSQRIYEHEKRIKKLESASTAS